MDGHTEKMALPLFHIQGRTVAYMADLIPSSAHIPLPYVMSYDVRPLLTMDEKRSCCNGQPWKTGCWFLSMTHNGGRYRRNDGERDANQGKGEID